LAGLTVLEICAGADGQAPGLELAGFEPLTAVEIDHDACETLRMNRSSWKVLEDDLHHIDARAYQESIILRVTFHVPRSQ
jgi:DNA (cytosine-5)-methyltransferase 1